MSSKNQLQEYYQKLHLAFLPKYITERRGGSSHQPLWQSTVTLIDETSIEGKIESNKTMAERSAAEAALQYLQSKRENRIKRVIPSRTVLLVDIENLPNFIAEVVEEVEGLDIIGFVGIHHCLVDRILPEQVIKVVSPSTRADGTDTCMQVYAGSLLTQNRYDTYLIATRDHFGAALVDILNSNVIQSGVTARIVTHIDHI